MSTSPDPRRRRRLSLVPVMLLVAVLVTFGVAATSLVPGIRLMWEQEGQLAEGRVQLAQLGAQNARLAEEAERLKDPAYLELIARTRYNLAKPGERLFNVIDAPAPKPARPKADVSKGRDTGWWGSVRKWLDGG